MRCVVQRLCTLSFFSLVVLFHSTQLLAQPSVFAAAIDALVGQFGYEAGGWRVDRHPRLLGDVNGDRRVDIVGFGNGGVGVALGQADGSFAAPIDALVGQFGYEAGGWRVDRHPRLLGDVNGDGRADIVGFGNGGVGVALAAAPAPVEPTPHNSANLFITEMVIADDFDGRLHTCVPRRMSLGWKTSTLFLSDHPRRRR